MTAEPGDDRLRLVLPLSMLAAVALRLLHWHSSATLHNDGPVFIALAQALAAGDVGAALAHEFHPLYSAAIAAAHVVLGPLGVGWETAAVWVSALAGAGSVWGLHAFVRSAFGPREAAFAAALLAVHGGAVDASADVQSEGLYLALFLASAAALWSALRTRAVGRAALAGVLSGLAYLTRPEGIGLALVGIALSLGLLAARRWSPRAALGFVCALVLGAAIGVAPYVGALYAETGEVWLTRKKSVSWVAGLAGPPAHFAGERTVPDWREGATPAGLELERPDPPLAAEAPPPPKEVPSTRARFVTALNDLMHSSFRAVRYELLAFLALGIYAVRGPPGLRAAFIGTVLALYGVVLFGLAFNVGYVSTRHVLAPASLLLGYVACGLTLLGAALARASGRRLGTGTAAALVLALVGGISVARALRAPDADNLVNRRAALWLRDQPDARGPVAASKRRTAYYAAAPFVKLRAQEPARFATYLDAYEVRYVIVDEDEMEDQPGMDAMIPDTLEPIHRELEGDAVTWVLRYRPGAAEAVR